MAASQLIGIWRDDAVFSPGAASEWRLYFAPDGRGRLDYTTWGTIADVIVFRWTADASHITITDAEERTGDRTALPSNTTPVPELVHAVLPYTITREPVPLRPAGIDVLSLDLGFSFVNVRWGRTSIDSPDPDVWPERSDS